MFTTAVIDGFFPPVPSETVLVATAAVAVSSGDMLTVVSLCVVAAMGAALGDNIAYAIGRKVGTSRFRWMRGSRVSAAFARAHSSLEHRGAALILGARYIPVGRVAVNMSAGALRYPWRRFATLSVIASSTWAAYSAGVGVLAGHWWKDQPLMGALLGVAIAVVMGVVIDRVSAWRHRAARANAPGAAPEADGSTTGVPGQSSLHDPESSAAYSGRKPFT